MELSKVISALNSKLRRDILKVLVDNPSTVGEVLDNLRNRGFNVKYRETVYRALEKLVDSGLVQKFYDGEKGICYRLSIRQIKIEIDKDSIDVI